MSRPGSLWSYYDTPTFPKNQFNFELAIELKVFSRGSVDLMQPYVPHNYNYNSTLVINFISYWTKGQPGMLLEALTACLFSGNYYTLGTSRPRAFYILHLKASYWLLLIIY